MKVLLLESAPYVPANATSRDAGYDIISKSEPKIVGKAVDEQRGLYKSIDYIEYDTELKIAPVREFGSISGNFYAPAEGHTLVFPRSSISKYNLVLANSVGLIDEAYRGSILLRFKYILQPMDLQYVFGELLCQVDMQKIYKQGDKIGQLVFSNTINPKFEKVKELPESDRGTGGFGSTDLKPDKDIKVPEYIALSEGYNPDKL